MPRGGAVDADRDDPRMDADGDGGLDRLPGRSGPAIPARVAQPGRCGDVVEQPDQDLGLADGRDRFESEEIGAGVDERLDPRTVELRQRDSARIVVAAVLRPVGEHRPVRPDRACHQERPAVVGLLAIACPRPTCELDAQSRPAEAPRPARPRQRRIPRSMPGSWRSWRPAPRRGNRRGGPPRWRPAP